jgi:hypothetical protein
MFHTIDLERLLRLVQTVYVLLEDVKVPFKFNFNILHFLCGPGSSVGIATGYGLDGPGIESRWGRDFPRLSIPTLGHTQSPLQWVQGLSRE